MQRFHHSILILIMQKPYFELQEIWSNDVPVSYEINECIILRDHTPGYVFVKYKNSEQEFIVPRSWLHESREEAEREYDSSLSSAKKEIMLVISAANDVLKEIESLIQQRAGNS